MDPAQIVPTREVLIRIYTSAGYQSVFITISSIYVSIFNISFDIFSWKGVGPIINQLSSF